jgi:hypothetical protein
MHTIPIDQRHVCWAGIVLSFTLTLIIVVHTSTINILTEGSAADLSPARINTAELTAAIIHGLAYSIACIATTVFLLICAVTILVLATILMELLGEALYLVLQLRQPTQAETAPPDAPEDPLAIGIHSDSWNYR